MTCRSNILLPKKKNMTRLFRMREGRGYDWVTKCD